MSCLPISRCWRPTESRGACRLLEGSLRQYDQILYLPMDETAKKDKPATIEAASQAGYTVRDLPVVHPRLFDAVLFQKTSSGAADAVNEEAVHR